MPCPIAPAIAQDTQLIGTGISKSFVISTDFPAVAYQINPYGAGVGAAVAGASLLIPTSAWGEKAMFARCAFLASIE